MSKTEFIQLVLQTWRDYLKSVNAKLEIML